MEKFQILNNLEDKDDQYEYKHSKARKIKKLNQSQRKENYSDDDQEIGLYTRQLCLFQYQSFYTNKLSSISSFKEIPDGDLAFYQGYQTQYHRSACRESRSLSFSQISLTNEQRRVHKTSFHDQLFVRNQDKIQNIADENRGKQQKVVQKININEKGIKNINQKQKQEVIFTGSISVQTMNGVNTFQSCKILISEGIKSKQSNNKFYVTMSVRGRDEMKFLVDQDTISKIKKTTPFLIESVQSWDKIRLEWGQDILGIEYL